jgi:hypothetical protein
VDSARKNRNFLLYPELSFYGTGILTKIIQKMNASSFDTVTVPVPVILIMFKKGWKDPQIIGIEEDWDEGSDSEPDRACKSELDSNDLFMVGSVSKQLPVIL